MSIIPPSGQVGPISDLERRTVIDASPLRQRGIAEQEFKGAWQEGDFKKFLPDLSGAAPVRRSTSWRGLVTWSAVAACCIFVVRAVLT